MSSTGSACLPRTAAGQGHGAAYRIDQLDHLVGILAAIARARAARQQLRRAAAKSQNLTAQLAADYYQQRGSEAHHTVFDSI